MRWFKSLRRLLARYPKDKEQLFLLLAQAVKKDILSPEIFNMIESVLRVAEMHVRDVMIAASQMIVVQQDSPLETILPIVIESGHSRFPVMRDGEVCGILLAKDLLTYSATTNEKAFQMQDIIRPTFFVPLSKRLDILLREFRIKRNHIAVVVDEYGHVAGLVTIEDVLEEIVGEIEDEYDIDEDEDIRKRAENIFLIKGSTLISDFNAYFSKDTLPDDEFDTVGGLILKGFGHFPKRGETLPLGKFRFKVLQSDARRIHLLEVKYKSKEK